MLYSLKDKDLVQRSEGKFLSCEAEVLFEFNNSTMIN